MEGLKEALEYAVGLSAPNYTEHEGEKWADKQMYRIHHKLPKADALQMNTLTSLIDYIKSNTDKMSDNMIIHIQSPTRVALLSSLDCDRCRELLAEVNALLPEFSFNHYYPAESFVINVMSKFIGNSNIGMELENDQLPWKGDSETDNDCIRNDKEIILKFAGTVESGTVAKYGDDGVSQKATIQQTCTSKEDVLVPNPVHLIPYRTFLEVEQPDSDFIFRMRDSSMSGGEPEIALFEADGGAWKIDAMNRIHEYLQERMKEVHTEQDITFTIIS